MKNSILLKTGMFSLLAMLAIAVLFMSSSTDKQSEQNLIKELTNDVKILKTELAEVQANDSPNSAEPFIGEIQMFGGNFAPRGWALCDGQLLPISQHSALFSLLGTTFGGDGRSTFGLPDLRGRVAVHPGTGPGLSNKRLGSKFGTELSTEISAQKGYVKVSGPAEKPQVPNIEILKDMNLDTRPSNNMQPSLGVNYIIALEGIYPSRN